MSESPQANLSPSPDTTSAPPRRQAGPSFFFPILLILVGIILLLNVNGILPWFAWWRLWVLWPAIFILIGVDILLRRAPVLLRLLAALVVVALLIGAAYLLVWQPGIITARPVHTVVALDDIREGSLQVDLGAGQLTIDPLGDSPNWAEVDLTGATHDPVLTRLDGTARLVVAQQGWTGSWPNGQEIRWAVRLNPRIPADLSVHVGVGECTLDLGRMNLQKITVNTGVGKCIVTLPGRGESGTIPVTIDGGIGSLHVIVPEGVAAQIRVDPGLGGVSVDESRFPKAGNDLYRTADYASAAYRLDIKADVGIGSIEVR